MTIKQLQTALNDSLNDVFSLRATITKQKEEIEHLQSLLIAATPLIGATPSNEEFIALNELSKLKAKSETQELTYEDAKRVELYFKIIRDIRNPKDKDNGLIKKYSTEELLSQVDSFGTKN